MPAAADSVVRARIDHALKREASEVFRSMGLTISDAIRMMLVQAVADQTLPFEVRSPNATTQDAMAAARAGDVITVESADDLFADLDKD